MLDRGVHVDHSTINRSGPLGLHCVLMALQDVGHCGPKRPAIGVSGFAATHLILYALLAPEAAQLAAASSPSWFAIRTPSHHELLPSTHQRALPQAPCTPSSTVSWTPPHLNFSGSATPRRSFQHRSHRQFPRGQESPERDQQLPHAGANPDLAESTTALPTPTAIPWG